MNGASTSPEAALWSIGQEAASAQRQLAELVMAWAKDAKTGEPRYIFELGESRRGMHSGCVCYSCGLPLTAVNAAKTEWRVRPHFRHPDGAERDACLVLTARAMALEQLCKHDTLLLPARRLGTTVVGVSGKAYQAWVTRPAERVRIRSFRPQDLVSAILTLEDGREVLVKLTGSLQEEQGGGVRPVIQLLVNDPTLAGLDPDALKGKLHLLVENGVWCGTHWNDDELNKAATNAAQESAQDALDWVPDAAKNELGAMPPHETLLHWLAKDALLHAHQICVPRLVLKEPYGVGALSGAVEVARRDSTVLQLSEVRLEKKVGQVRPDVVAQYLDPTDGATGQLLVEITVTNGIHPERLERIRQQGHAALEINIAQLGGNVTRQEFVRLVTEEVAAKTWLCHPWLLEQEVERKAQLDEQARQNSEAVKALAAQYLSAAKHYAALRALDSLGFQSRTTSERAKAAVQDLGLELEAWGIEHAADAELYGWQGCILDRLMSIRHNQPIGYRLESCWQVVNAVLCEKDAHRLAWHSLYLIALKVYSPPLTSAQSEKVSAWREAVLASLKSGEAAYRRPRRFDEVLGLLFPEMRAALQKPLPGESRKDGSSADGVAGESVRRQALPFGPGKYRERNGEGLWLRGAELEDWKRQNPEAARAWGQRNRR